MTTTDGTVLGKTKIVDNGDPALRLNIVVLGDGYQSAQLGQYAVDAQAFADNLFATSPFDLLRPAINIFRVDVSSTDSGADDPTECGGSGATPATYFDANFCNGEPGKKIQRLLEVDAATALQVAGDQVPECHFVVVIVNSTVYGGSGGNGVAVYSLALDPPPVHTALHEMGHALFGLADEYSYFVSCAADHGQETGPSIEPTEPNVTTVTDRATLKWAGQVAAGTPIPTTSNPDCAHCDPATGPPAGLPFDVVGTFEGARYFHCGIHRPQFDCRMRTIVDANKQPVPFCGVCAHQIRVVLRHFMPPVLDGLITFLEVNEVGAGFGPPDSALDAEVVVGLDTDPERFFGFAFRADENESARRGMLDALRTARRRGRPVRLDFEPVGTTNGKLLAVSDLA